MQHACERKQYKILINLYFASTSPGYASPTAAAGSTIGGVCPLIITALQAATGATFFAPAIVLAATGIITVVASVLLIKYYPAANKCTHA
jgi:hypothetical protein